MKSKFWILLGAVLLLLLWGTRERFEPTANIKAPPYDDAEKDRIWGMLTATSKQAFVDNIANGPAGVGQSVENNTRMARHVATMMVQKFYTDKYATATEPITNTTIDNYIPSTGLTPSYRSAAIQLLNAYFVEQGSPASTPPASAMTSTGRESGNTTGGSSTSSFGPTAGGTSGSKFMVWGPVGGGRAEGDGGVQGMDTSKTNNYPELLGGLGAGGDKTRIDGVGLTEPSSSWKLGMSGVLPDMKSLGATELSKYLPFSRTPGDMEKIPDPYRVSQTFTTSSYSSKTEPVPFLADFSAFQK